MKISVIIPTCNRSNTITRAIDSVLNQNIEDIEIIVVDDSMSEDNTTEILVFQYAESRKLRYFRNKSSHHGPSGARNYGVSQAVGEFITFLDDDDMYMPGRLINQLKVAETGKYIFVSSGRFCEIDDFNYIERVEGQLKGVVTLSQVVYGNDIDIGFMIKRDDFIRLGRFDNNLTSLEDWDFVIRMLMAGDGYKIDRLDYVVNINSDRPRVSNSQHIGYLEIAEKYREKYGDKWYAAMLTMSALCNNSLSLLIVFKLSFFYKSILPIKMYIDSKKNNIL